MYTEYILTYIVHLHVVCMYKHKIRMRDETNIIYIGKCVCTYINLYTMYNQRDAKVKCTYS